MARWVHENLDQSGDDAPQLALGNFMGQSQRKVFFLAHFCLLLDLALNQKKRKCIVFILSNLRHALITLSLGQLPLLTFAGA